MVVFREAASVDRSSKRHCDLPTRHYNNPVVTDLPEYISTECFRLLLLLLLLFCKE